MKLCCLSILFLLVGCAVLPSQASRDEQRALIGLAREHLRSSGSLTASELMVIDSEQPRVSYYFFGRPYGDYRLEWRLHDGTRLMVIGRGDVLRLENPRILREPNKAPEPTHAAARSSQGSEVFNLVAGVAHL